MTPNQSANPAVAAGLFISERLKAESAGDILLLLSGGSAFQVLNHIDPYVFGSHVTVMMADERFTTNPSHNNYMQLLQTDFYEHLERSGAKTISSVPDTTNSTAEDYAYGINKLLKYYFKTHPDAYVLALLGLGEDGHTASIFPQTTEEEFNAIYRTNELYLATPTVGEPGLPRTTISPYFLKNYLNQIIFYAAGESKQNVITELLIGNKPVHELPALLGRQHPGSTLFTDCEV